jgi:hypothetical protein
MFWMRRTTCRATLAGIAITTTLALVCGAAGNARAGEYHVYSCRMPDGQVAPTDGWSGSATGAFVYAEDKCAKGGALTAALGDGVEHEGNDLATWTLGLPTGETLAGVKLWRAGDADGGVSKKGTYEFWLAGPSENEVFDECVYGGSTPCEIGQGELEEPLSAANLLDLSSSHLGSYVYANAACFATLGLCKKGERDPNGYAAVVYLYAADLTLEQASQPTVSDVEGELATSSTLSGTADLSLHAEDAGSGVYQAVFTVDGQEVGRTLLDENAGHCHNVGQTSDGLPAFLYLQPCPPSVSADLPLDTTTLSDGAHHLVVTVTNAAGNSVVALDRKITVLNHPQATPPAPPPVVQTPPNTTQHDPSSPNPITAPIAATPLTTAPAQSANGTPSSAAATLRIRWAATARAALTGSYGHSQTVLGQLSAPNGAPIAGALVQVLFTPAYERAPTRELEIVHTGSEGSFRLHVPASVQSGRITFAYSSHAGQPAPDITAALTLTVPANLSLSVTPRTSHAGGTIAFRGTLRGSPLPPGGKQLVLEARTLHGSWRQFQVLSTTPHGRYRASYRFRLAGPISYQFRALSTREADFPYGAGSSNVVLVHER